MSQVTSVIGRAHCSVTVSLARSIEYCKKDGDFTESGVIPNDGASSSTDRQPRSSSRDDEMEAFKNSVKEGCLDMKLLREVHSSFFATNWKFASDYVKDHQPKHKVKVFPLRGWQEELNRYLRLEPNSRHIYFVVDLGGNQGKSWFSRYYSDLHENTQIIVPGRKKDMAHVVKEDTRVFFFDCPRSKQGEFIQYDFLEELKNGYIFSPKYDSSIKRLATPHIVVFMNEAPDMTKLSSDRYVVMTLTGETYQLSI